MRESAAVIQVFLLRSTFAKIKNNENKVHTLRSEKMAIK